MQTEQKSKVYFTDMRVTGGNTLQGKLEKLLRRAGMDKMPLDRQFVAIKIHFGEPGNLAYLRPNFSKTVADIIKEQGGLPFLTDCNTLYVGRRKHALEHIDAAYENGYSPFSTGCQVIIADGLKGTDEVEVPVVGGEYCKTAKIGRAVMDADVIIALSHFKGHENVGFGGALKNIGMGCGSRAGKMEMHNSGKPTVSKSRCRACGMCAKICAHQGIAFNEAGKAYITESCVGCGRCLANCRFDAIFNASSSSNDELNCKIAEYSKAVVDGRPAFYINIVNQVSPYCDCHADNDAALIPDVGMFASFDPVALDVACADACNAMMPIANSQLGDMLRKNPSQGDMFRDTFPTTNWRSCMEHAQKLGLGTMAYELITV